MKLIPAKTPRFVKSVFPNFVWNIDTPNKELYLTFDDGPTPQVTPWVLEQLKAYNAKATFFCIGSNIEKYPEILKAILSDGHTVGNHTYNHLKGWKHKTKAYLEDVSKTKTLINSNLFRPPYGKLKNKQAKRLQQQGYKIIMWDVLSFDWDVKVSEEECFEKVINSARKGSIIVLHDSIKAERNLKSVLPRVLEYYSGRGYVFKSVLIEN